MDKTTIDINEVKKFESLSDQWWKDDGSFGSLHKINPIRIEYILSKIKQYLPQQKDHFRILDVGCGGGIASMPFARLGFNVTGIDAGINNINVAMNYAKEHNINIRFLNETAEEHLNQANKYDVILCLEMIEHVNNVELLINSLAKLLNKDGIIIISTINRTLKAKFLAIGVAESILNILPKNTHNFDKFVKPSEISNLFYKNNLTIKEIRGIIFDIFSMKWILSDKIDVNYICVIK